MLDTSSIYKKMIRGHVRHLNWYGTITATDGKVYPFTMKNIVKGSGSVVRSISGGTSLEIGSVYASEFDVGLYLDVDRYTLYGATIDLYFSYTKKMFDTWEELSAFTWDEAAGLTWGGMAGADFKIGTYTVNEATRDAVSVSIKSYDKMLAFDKDCEKANGLSRTPYQWLQLLTSGCKVKLGMTEAEVSDFSNGTTRLTYSKGNSESTPTYRDVLAELAKVLCAVAVINRNGELELLSFGTKPVEDIPASWRFSSKISDYITRYTGLYSTSTVDGYTYYYTASGVSDTGLVYNIGTSPFIQAGSKSSRDRICQNIINALSKARYTPFEAEVPLDPSFEPGDVLSLSGNQANNETVCLSEITYHIGGRMDIKCVGENPRFIDVKSRYTKNIEGLIQAADSSSDSELGTFWMSNVYNAAAYEGEEETVTNALDFTVTADKGRGALIWTGVFTIDTSGIITVKAFMDGKVIYTMTDFRLSGDVTLTVSTPFDVDNTSSSTHEIKISLSFAALTAAEVTALNTKIPAIDSTASENGTNAISSGAVFTIEKALTALTDRVKALEDKT